MEGWGPLYRSGSTMFAVISARLSRPEWPETAGRAPRRLSGLSSLFTLDQMLATGLCVASIGFFLVAYTISVNDPDYFNRQLLASMRPSDVDPIITGAVEAGDGGAMPAPAIVRAAPLVPADFQIVMVFQDEAILATDKELWRVKVGSEVPCLGTVLAIDATDTGGTVKAT